MVKVLAFLKGTKENGVYNSNANLVRLIIWTLAVTVICFGIGILFGGKAVELATFIWLIVVSVICVIFQ